MASSLFVVLVIILVLATSSTNADITLNTTAVEEACSRTLHSDFCVKSITADPNAFITDPAVDPSADTHKLTGFVIRIAANKAVENAVYMDALSLDMATTGDESLSQTLSDCAEHFTDATSQLDSSGMTLDNNDYATVEMLLGAAMADAATCNEELKLEGSEGPETKEIEKRNEDFFKLCNIVLVFNKILSNQS